MKILLAEDYPELRVQLSDILTAAGHSVDVAADGTNAWHLTQNGEYDMLILDWMLPGLSGIELCQQYRKGGHESPVLMLTGRSHTNDRVTGLDAGADDYVVKPVEPAELLARVRALGRRAPLWNGDILAVADLQLHLTRFALERNECKVQLSSREFQLIEHLMRHPRQIVSHANIERALWDWNNAPESNAIAALIRRLRQRLRQLGADGWLETVYGAGYRLNPPEAETANRPEHASLEVHS